MAHVIALANHKGGVGKTTSTANLGAALAQMGQRVLLIDADPQGNLTEAFGLHFDDRPGDRLEDLLAEPIDGPPQAWTTRVDLDTGEELTIAAGVHLLPCTAELAVTATELSGGADAQGRLRDLVETLDDRYDWIAIDTPPGLNALSSMALLACQGVIVPAKPADFDISGAVNVANLVENEVSAWNPDVRVLGVLVTMSDRRWNIGWDTRSALKDAQIDRFEAEIPVAVRVASAPRYAAPTVVLEPKSKVARAYQRAAREVMERMGVAVPA